MLDNFRKSRKGMNLYQSAGKQSYYLEVGTSSKKEKISADVW